MKKNKSSGYTLVEILLVLGMITVFAGVSMPIYQAFQVKNYLNLGVGNVAQALRRAQLMAQAVELDSQWGVKVETGKIILFRGAGFSARDTAYDEITELPESLTPSGDMEFVFLKLTGLPQSTGNLIISSNTGEQTSIAVNPKGIVEY